ncbi:MAG: SurA N-terminal domain-containing protein [Gammaproteobacteria bacterium]|nr:SurA N-terminal domain-containing protein [Gammaproteobacteria bacterium]
MLQKLRDQTQGTAFKIIVGALVFALAFFGFGAFVFTPGEPEIASVNGDAITQTMLANETERERRRMLVRFGQVDPNLIDPASLQASVLELLIGRALLRQSVDDLNIMASQSQIDELVVGNPNFQVDGVFNADLYRRNVQALGFSPPDYLEEVALSLSLDQLRGGITHTGVLTDWEMRLLTKLMKQRRDLAYLPFTVAHFSEGVDVGEVEIATYYDEHHLAFMTEESVDVAFVELASDQLLDDESIVIEEDAMLREYETEKTDVAGGEQRQSSHILLRVDEDRTEDNAIALLADLKKRIEKGASFAELAEYYSEDPGSADVGGELGSVGKGIFDPDFERALWTLEEGQLSDPVRSEFGYHLIRLDGIEMHAYPSFEEQREAIELRLRQAAAVELFFDRVRELDNLAFEQSSDLEGITLALGLQERQVQNVTRTAGERVFVNANLRDALFQDDVLLDGNNTVAIEYGDNRAVVARVTNRYQPELKSLDTVRIEVREILTEAAAKAALRTARDAAYARIMADESVAEVADTYDLEWQTFELTGRSGSPVQAQVLTVAFDLPRPPEGDKSVGKATMGEAGEAIVTVTRVVDGDLSTMTDSEVERLRNLFSSRTSRLDFAAVYKALEAQADITRP